MGYYASGFGTLYLKREAPDEYDKLAANLGTNNDPLIILGRLVIKAQFRYGLSLDVLKDNAHPDCYCLDIHYEYEKYYEEGIYEFLELIRPLLVSIDHHTGIYFAGEDDTYWRITVPRDGEYTETSGELVFDGQKCTTSCAFQNKGYCHCHKVHGRYPIYEKDNCSEYVYDPKKEESENVV